MGWWLIINVSAAVVDKMSPASRVGTGRQHLASDGDGFDGQMAPT
jgi:hypothetical protein